MSDGTQNHGDTGADGQRIEGDANSLTLVESLMAERRKYEQWLAALEARRSTTPERVFTRVHTDYHDRLDAVIEQLKEHTEGLRAELASLTLRLTALEEEQQQRQDERAEAELRAHVGELSREAWEKMAHDADESIGALGSRHDELESERGKTRHLLAEAERPSPARGAQAIAAAGASAAPAPAEPRAPAPPAPAPPPQAQAPSQAPAAAAPAAPVAAPAAAQPAPRVAPPPRAAEPVAAAGHVQPPAPVMAEHVPPAEPRAADAAAAAERADADVTPRPTQRADASHLPGEKKGTFDELAFLSSVVNTPPGPMEPAPTERPDERARRDSFAQRAPDEGIVNLSSDPAASLNSAAARAASSPLAMNVSGNIPIVLKDKSSEAAKSLKCGECGAMNYPTEWYCERCGAELASL
jgi:hypothetical protein